MGQGKSTYCGVGATPQDACADLEKKLIQTVDPHAFVRVTNVIPMSPRAVPHQSLAHIKNSDHRVSLNKMDSGFKASVSTK